MDDPYIMTAERLVKEEKRYSGFTLLSTPEKFSDFFKDTDALYVQVLSMHHPKELPEGEVLGFCGVFAWKENELAPLDGDSYSPDMTVYGFKWFSDKNGKGLDILVGDDW